MTNSIQVKGISKKYKIGSSQVGTLYHTLWHRNIFRKKTEEFWALEEITFEAREGEVLGIIGRNGAGKTTLLKILSRITTPDAGYARLKGRVSSLLEVGTGFHGELTGRENIFLNGAILGMRRAEIRKRFDEIVEFSGIEKYLDTPVKHYSSGMYMRIAFTVAAHLVADILLVDEVLAVGDQAFQNKCLGKLEDLSTNNGKTVLFVSHNMDVIHKLCTRALWIDNGKIAYEGNVEKTVYQYLHNTKASTIDINHAVVKKISVDTLNGVSISLHYDFDYPPIIPDLGIVIRTQFGTNLCATNAELHNESRTIEYSRKGVVTFYVKKPILNPGTYFVSIRFNDGLKDIYVADDLVSFTIPGSLKYKSQGSVPLEGIYGYE